MMSAFSQCRSIFEESILGGETHPSLGSSCNCGDPSAIFQCQECFQSLLWCTKCILHAHELHPFHFIDKWIGTHFEKTTLCDLGYILHLGHNNHPCPNCLRDSHCLTTIVHSNSVQEACIMYCHCFQAPSNIDQLCQVCLFPATMVQPQTIFTFDTLDDFLAHMHASKKSAYDHYSALRSWTDGACPENVPVRF